MSPEKLEKRISRKWRQNHGRFHKGEGVRSFCVVWDDTTYYEDGQLIFLSRAPKTELQIIKQARDLTCKSKESNIMGKALTVPVPENSTRTREKINKGGSGWKD